MTPTTRLCALALTSSLMAVPALAQSVNLYTTREPGLLNPVLESFTKDILLKFKLWIIKHGC